MKEFLERVPVSGVKNKKGYAVFYGVVVVGAAVLAGVVSMGDISFSGIKSFRDFKDGKNALFLAESCCEEGLRQVRNSTSFSGSGELNIFDRTCFFEVERLSGQEREVRCRAESGRAIEKIKVQIDQINPQINISSWDRVAEF